MSQGYLPFGVGYYRKHMVLPASLSTSSVFYIDLEGAQFAMAMLAVLQEKTKGNLTADESSELLEVISHLQQRFMQIAQLVAAQMQREGTSGGMGGSAAPGSPILGSIGSPRQPARASSGPRIELP